METGKCSLCRETQARFACSCVFPIIPVCEVCIIAHLGTEGAHMPVPIKKPQQVPSAPAQGNEMCDECGHKEAVRFCLCRTPLRKFCDGCDTAHYEKARLLTHSNHPIIAYQAVISGKVPIETFRKKQFYINDLQLRIGEELTNFDAFMRQVEEDFEALLSKIAAKKEEILRDLLTQRAKLASVLTETQEIIETKRYTEGVEVNTELDEYLANGYVTSAVYDLKMFKGKLDLAGINELMNKAAVYELTPHVLQNEIMRLVPVIKANILRLFHPVTF